MKIALASDHGGFELKKKVQEYLQQKGIEVLDLGCHSEDAVYYPEYGKACGEAVMKGKAEKGIAICGNGVGMSMTANKVKGIRCALCTNLSMAEKSRKYIDANVLALGGKDLEKDLALSIVEIWLNTEFEGGRHQNGVDMLDSL